MVEKIVSLSLGERAGPPSIGLAKEGVRASFSPTVNSARSVPCIETILPIPFFLFFGGPAHQKFSHESHFTRRGRRKTKRNSICVLFSTHGPAYGG